MNRKTKMLLPIDSAERKAIPVGTGVVDYFPLALAEVAKCSKQGNDQHHPGKSLHWDKSKSTDHADCLLRHFIDRGKTDSTGIRESARMAWRALALLQIELESEQQERDQIVPEADSEDWIPHSTGFAPDLPAITKIQLKLADGTVFTALDLTVEDVIWKNSESDTGKKRDIAAYRIVK